MAPHRSNRKGDLGNYRPQSGAADIDNIYFTEEGWVYRHFKGDPRDPNTRFWDEIIVAGQVDTDDTQNGDPLETVNATPRHYLGLGSTDESNSTDGYDADGTGYATDEIDFETVVLRKGNTRIIGATDGVFDIEYKNDYGSNSGGGGDPTPIGGCKDASDCPPGYVCNSGNCVPDTITPPGGCTSDADCPPGHICVAGNCEPDPALGCSSDSDCGPDEICDNGVCVPDPNLPTPGCSTDSDCGPGEICDNGKCVPAPTPINIGNVTVDSLHPSGEAPDLNETHGYKFSIDGNAADAEGILRIEPVDAGTVVDADVTWTKVGPAKVIFDVTSDTADDNPQAGELDINVKDAPVAGDPYIGNVTVTGPTDVIRNQTYEYIITFDGDADPDRCYVRRESNGNFSGVINADYIGNGQFRFTDKIKDNAASTFELLMRVTCFDDVVEDGNYADGTLEINTTAPTTTVSSARWEYSNPSDFALVGGNAMTIPGPRFSEDAIEGRMFSVTFNGTSQDYVIDHGKYHSTDTLTYDFIKNEGNKDYWMLNIVYGDYEQTRSGQYLEINGTRLSYNKNVSVKGTVSAPVSTTQYLNIDNGGGEPYRYSPIVLTQPRQEDQDGNYYWRFEKKFPVNAGGGVKASIGSKSLADVRLLLNQGGYNGTPDSLMPRNKEVDYMETHPMYYERDAYHYVKVANLGDILPLSDITFDMVLENLYPAGKQEVPASTPKATFVGNMPDIDFFEVSGMANQEATDPARWKFDGIYGEKWGYGDHFPGGDAEWWLSFDVDRHFKERAAALQVSVDVDFSDAPSLTKVHQQLQDGSIPESDHPTSYDFYCKFNGDFHQPGKIKVSITYNSGQGRLTKTATYDLENPENDLDQYYFDLYREDKAEFPQWYLDYVDSFTNNSPPGGGGDVPADPLGDLDVVDPTNGQPVEGFQSYTFSVSNSGGDAATYLWSVTGDAKIIGDNDQSSVEVELEYTGNNDVNLNGTAAVTVQATSSDDSQTKSLTSDLIVLKPLPVIGSVTVNSETDPVRATEATQWSTTVTQGLDSGPTESENTVWTVTPDAGVTIVQDGTNQATITFPDTQAYDVTAELTRTNSRGDSDPVSGTSAITPNAAPVPNTTYTYDVTVVDNGGNKFVLNGEGLSNAETPQLTIAEGDVIRFNQADASNAGHPIRVYRQADKGGLPVASLSQVGTPGDGANAMTVYNALDGAGTYYYECENHTGMGGEIIVTA
jgi:plastocyanin